MPRGTISYLIIDNLEKPELEREGVLVVLGATKDSARTRTQAIELARTLWEEDQLPAERFANGIAEDSIVPVSERTEKPNLLPVEQGAVELCQLLALQVAYQEACLEAQPMVAIVQAVLEEERSLTPEELEIAKDKKTAKTIHKVAYNSAELRRFRESMSGNAKLILEVIRGHGTENVTVDTPESISIIDN